MAKKIEMVSKLLTENMRPSRVNATE